ncbi:hypothetical protein BIV60_17975 [Bacillus sp. MUM 116]|uniref:hypothetical protein n=1 Tax=Bacillus sp. MUM 116 TaxID=1678002 RepID=UPI0008F585C5|nr:hypothetical protein [Bacillus sp. MUM 116]OIK11567.1 hypothetical protein BIV60_17975 [Bacillus sp. MUM 116]
MAKAKKEDYLTNAPKETQFTIENGSIYPNMKNVAGDSVDRHMELIEANIVITGDEIKQQNENL